MSDGAVDSTAAHYAPGVDVIVCNYRTALDLRGFLESYDLGDDAHLYVVNVCPHDDDRRVVDQYIGHLSDYPMSRLTHIELAENIGFNRAVNRAGSLGEREYVAVFNADVELTAGAIDALVGALHDHPEWGVVGPRQVDERGLLTAPGIFGSPDHPQWRCWREPGHDGRFSDVRDDCVTVLGSAFVMRRVVWDQLTACLLYRDVAPTALGPLLPCAHYYGETAAMYHAAAHGWLLAFLGTTTITHKWHRASPEGGHGEMNRTVDHAYFGRFCDHHSLAHD